MDSHNRLLPHYHEHHQEFRVTENGADRGADYGARQIGDDDPFAEEDDRSLMRGFTHA